MVDLVGYSYGSGFSLPEVGASGGVEQQSLILCFHSAGTAPSGKDGLAVPH